MIEVKIWQIVCAVIASAMGGATIGFLAFAIFANCKYRDHQFTKDE